MAILRQQANKITLLVGCVIYYHVCFITVRVQDVHYGYGAPIIYQPQQALLYIRLLKLILYNPCLFYYGITVSYNCRKVKVAIRSCLFESEFHIRIVWLVGF